MYSPNPNSQFVFYADTSDKEWLVIDGIPLDPVTLCAVGPDGNQLAPTKMGVKELRAELAARQSPLRGNKRELTRQLQKARAEAEVLGSSLDNGKDSSKKVEVILVEESWDVGNLVSQNTYEDERLVEDVDEDEDEMAITTIDEVEEEEDEERSAALDDDDDDFDLDYDDRVSSMMKAQGRFNVEYQSRAWGQPGIREVSPINNPIKPTYPSYRITRILERINNLCDSPLYSAGDSFVSRRHGNAWTPQRS